MKPNKERSVKPPSPSFDNPYVPIVTERDAGKDFIKHDFDEESINIPLSKAMDKKVKRDKDGCFMFWNEGDKKLPVYEHIPCTKGVVDPEFDKKHNLSSFSKPRKL